MNWAKENPFLTGFLVAVALVAGGLGYFAYSQYTTATELAATYESEVQKLHKLQENAPFPSEENLKKTIESKNLYQEALAGLEKSLTAKMLPLPEEITPQEFQDELRRAVSDAEKQAAEAGMQLPESFYLGFDSYSATLPSQQAVPHLARELKAIESLFAGLTDAGVEHLLQLTRTPLAVERGAAPAAPANAKGQPGTAPVSLVEKNVIDLTFSGEQSRVRLALNSFLNSPQFALIRALKIQNSSPLSPPVSAPAETGGGVATGSHLSNSESPTSPKALNMLFGREKVTVQVRLELLDFHKLPDAKTP